MTAGGQKTAARARRENFPVASRLIPAEHRPTILAFYAFARAADDIADRPGVEAAEGQRALADLDAILAGDPAPANAAPPQARAAATDLRDRLTARGVSVQHARHLLQAFQRDLRKNRTDSWSDLLAYCRYSAAPVGRFLLDLHGEDRSVWGPADALCAALQILNHLQDCQADYRRLDRVYIPANWLRDAGLTADALAAPRSDPALRGVFDLTLEGVDRLLAAAAPLPAAIRHRRLRLEAAVILSLAQALRRALARRDPLAARVRLSPPARLWAGLIGLARGLKT